MRKLTVAIILGSSFLLTACPLMTRTDVKEAEQKKQMQDQVITLQRTAADSNSRFAEVDNDLRNIIGKVEVLENRIGQTSNDREKSDQSLKLEITELSKRVLILQEEISRLDGQVSSLQSELATVKAGAADSKKESSSVKKNAYDEGEDHFEKKDWKKAILSYQKFRDSNSKNKKFADATYKIGVCFQELGMKDEAKTFYDEVIEKFPNSGEAKRARTRLKSLKK